MIIQRWKSMIGWNWIQTSNSVHWWEWGAMLSRRRRRRWARWSEGRRSRPSTTTRCRSLCTPSDSIFWLSFFLICFLFLSFVFLNWFGGRRSLTTTLTATGSTRDWLKLFCWDEDYSVASKLSVSLKFCFTLWEKKERERHGTDSEDEEWQKDEREQTGKKKKVKQRNKKN
jgi:hypothetical protein